jgi:hypothetical protein
MPFHEYVHSEGGTSGGFALFKICQDRINNMPATKNGRYCGDDVMR